MQIITPPSHLPPQACNSLSTRNRKQTMTDFSQPSSGTSRVVSLSWSPQRLYNCGEELWLTCWLHWTPLVSRCRRGSWKTSLSRSPADRIKIFRTLDDDLYSFYSFLTNTVLKGEIEFVGLVHVLIARKKVLLVTFPGATATKNINFHVLGQLWHNLFPSFTLLLIQ